jgi:ribonuclease BN (tRNA processing enzyme)
LHITVLGKSPAWQDADGACSGYLIEEDSTCLLLDCGNGVFSKLRRCVD